MLFDERAQAQVEAEKQMTKKAKNSKQKSKDPQVDFGNTEVAFAWMSSFELKKSIFMFRTMGINWLNNLLQPLASKALSFGLPIKPLVKNSVFELFCGGETLEECKPLFDRFNTFGVQAMVDYSAEGGSSSKHTKEVYEQKLKALNFAMSDPNVSASVVKITGLISNEILKKVSAKKALSSEEQADWDELYERLKNFGKLATKKQIRLLIDAEESWIQPAIDQIAWDLMLEFNQSYPCFYTTIQMYLKNKEEQLQDFVDRAKNNKVYLGVKLVRGAYMEKERNRAEELGYESPVQPNKKATDEAYDRAVDIIFDHVDHVAACIGTHNQGSTELAMARIQQLNIKKSRRDIFFSQLLGMSDNLTYNLSSGGFSVAKLVPFGPVQRVIPYLIRRAKENSSVQGQIGRELNLLIQEKKRRKEA